MKALKGSAWAIRCQQWLYSIHCHTVSVEDRPFIHHCTLKSRCEGSEFVLIQDLPPTNHVNVELYGALCIVTEIGRHAASSYGALEALHLRHTLHTEPLDSIAGSSIKQLLVTQPTFSS